MKTLRFLPFLSSVALGANLTLIAEKYPGPIMNTDSITQKLEPYTAVYEGRVFINNIQPTDVCINSFGLAGIDFDTNSTYALEVGAIAPTQTKRTRAGYDNGALYFKLVRTGDDKFTVKFSNIEAVSSLDNGANRGSGPWGMYWQTAISANSSIGGYNIDGKYVWTTVGGHIGGVSRPTCKGTYYLGGDDFDDTWALNGTASADKARWSLVRKTVQNGVLVQTLIYTFDGAWVDSTAKLLTTGTTLQTEGQWAGFPKTSDGIRLGLSALGSLCFIVALHFLF